MTPTPAVSIIMPVHNGAEWLAETLQSILATTFDPQKLEIIFVDDASTDNSAAIARHHLAQGQIPWQIVESQARNSSSARNRGLEVARAAWIQFFDADDLMVPEKFTWQCPVAEQAPAEVGLLFSDFQHYELTLGRWERTKLHTYAASPEDAIVDLIRGDFFVHLTSGLLRRSWLDRVNGFDPSAPPIEDVNLSLRLVCAGAKVQYVPTPAPVFYYRLHSRSMTKQMPDRFVEQCAQNAQLVETFLRDAGGLNKQRSSYLASVYLMAARYFAGQRKWNLFEQMVTQLERLQSPFVPDEPRRLRVLSHAVGYRKAERLIVEARKLRDWIFP